MSEPPDQVWTLSRFVACPLPECPLYGIVYEIPYSMLTSAEEEVLCGTCGRITRNVPRTKTSEPAINAEQAMTIHAQNRSGFFVVAAGPAAFPLLGGSFEANEAARKAAATVETDRSE